MKQITKIFAILLLWSCTSNRADKKSMEPSIEPREVELLEWIDINKTDSIQLITTWQAFIKNLEAQKGRSSDSVECWSAEAFQYGNYSAPRVMTVDSCITHLVMPLRKTNIWPLFKTNNCNVGIQKYESEQVGRYFISFPRDRGSKYHEFKYTFFFKKQNGEYRFNGHVYN